MEALGLAGDFDAGLYNRLGEVEDANRVVREGGALGEFLGEVAGLFLEHEMQDRFGVSLLHRHHRCGGGERMVETAGRFAGQDALVTRPTADGALWDEAVPSVWALRDGRYVPLEYTTDTLAADMLFQGEVPAAFLAAYGRVAGRSPIGSLMGLSVVARRLYAEADADEIGLEYSNLTPRSSTVVLANRHDTMATSLETRWAFKRNIETTSACVQECVQICHLGDGPGGHTGRQVHTPGRHKW